MIKVKYNHPSVPNIPIDINKVYFINRTKDKYFININKKEVEINLYDIKTLFEVVDGELEDLSEVKLKTKVKNNKQEFQKETEKIKEIQESV